ncbi:MAG: CoA pyrophosphatase [Planctomycetota bacterium]
MPEPWPAELASRLTPAGDPFDRTVRHAAVAVVLQGLDNPGILFMQRAHREGDRWSGHVAFPGGHLEDYDADLVAGATRETVEEVGVDLAAVARPLGRLPAMQARARGAKLPLWVTPVVFEQFEPTDPVLGPEASAAFRVPLESLLSGELAGEKRIEGPDKTLRYPAWQFEQWTIWGMTYHILDGLLAHFHAMRETPGW